ncbi:hypothetical protein [uncultured Mediterranean phage uvDeep-CGR2-KM24-C26]|nr:hypothetical protein [uncultured Mediterranean phage uvDeep-CGR2-KM24-C26]
MVYLKRTDGRNKAGEGRTIRGVSLRRDAPGKVVFIADRKRTGDVVIKKGDYDKVVAANNAWTASHQKPVPPTPREAFEEALGRANSVKDIKGVLLAHYPNFG